MIRDLPELLRHLRDERQEPLCAFVYDLDTFTAHVRAVVSRLPSWAHMFYAVKANSDEPLLRAVAPLVRGFEAASLGEIRKVRSVAPEAPIIFGGPAKTDVELGGALGSNVQWFHLESLNEGLRLESVAARLGQRVPVLLRVNLRGPLPQATLQMSGKPTQFGIDEGGLLHVARQLLQCPHLQIVGFHLHCLSNQLDASIHLQLVELYCQKVREWEQQLGLESTCLNAGGGIGVNYQAIDRQFDWPTFADGLQPLWNRQSRPPGELILECGRYLSASCGKYVCEVIDVKRNHGEAFALLCGGSHHFRLPSSWQHNHPFSVVHREAWPYSFPRPQLSDEPVTLAGQLCTPKDVLAKQVPVKLLRPGDLVVFEYAGAYGWAISHHDFLSHPHPHHIYL